LFWFDWLGLTGFAFVLLINLFFIIWFGVEVIRVQVSWRPPVFREEQLYPANHIIPIGAKMETIE